MRVFGIPSLEMSLVMKLSAMSSLYRADEDTFRDAHDFIKMATANWTLDEETVEERALGIYSNGGKDTVQMIPKVRTGEWFELWADATSIHRRRGRFDFEVVGSRRRRGASWRVIAVKTRS
jgi:hypothetical protein